MAAYRFLVSGAVQGVGYRYFALRRAQALGVSGFVRNVDDGCVEVVAEGTPSQLEEFESCLREGPRLSSVESVERGPASEFDGRGFVVR
jgi:acylphosphatase